MTNYLTEDRVLVSIICTSYNQFEYLKFTVKSILEQSYPHIELIIVDDASTEGSFDEQCLIGFIDQNNYFKVPYKLIINEVNIGHTSSLNKGLNYCNGEYIIYVNGDDLLPKNSITQLVEYQKKYNYDLVGGCLAILNKNNEIINRHDCNKREVYFHSIDKNKISKKIIIDQYLPFTMPGSLFSRYLLTRIGGFEEAYTYFEDLILFYKVTEEISLKKIGFMPNLTYIWRDYSGVTSKDIDLDVEKKSVMQNRLALIYDHLVAYKFFLSNTLDSQIANHCESKVEVLSIKYDILEARLSSSPFIKSIKAIIKHRKSILSRITIRRIKRYINGRVEA